MPTYYRLSKKDLDVLENWWSAYNESLRGEPSLEDTHLYEFLEEQRASIRKGKGAR